MTQITQQTPAGWEVMKFNEFIELSYGSNLPKEKREKGEIPVYGSNGITDRHNEALVAGPGIVVGRKGSIGQVHWSESDFWPIDTTYYITKDKDKNLKWIYYKLQTLGLEGMNTASGIPGLNRNEVYNLKIAVPPLPEQIKISTILSKVDEEIEKVERIIEQTEKLKKGLMQKLLTKGIGHTKFKQSELGEIPEEWEVVKLEDICELITDGKHGDCNNDENSGYYFVSVKDIFDGEIHYENARQITKEDFLEVNKRTQFESKDLLITNSGTIGRIAIGLDDEKTKKTTFQKSVAVIKPIHDLVSVVFLAYVLNVLKDRLIVDSSGSAQKNLLLRDLRAAKVFFPNIVEQKKIASIISLSDDKISINKKNKSYLLKLKKGLMKDLLSGKVRVN